MIQFAIMTFPYITWENSEKGSPQKLIQILADAGADGMEAFCNPFMKKEKFVKLYQKELHANNIKMPVMDLIVNLACADRKERTEAYDLMRRGIDICDAFESKVVHIAGCESVQGISPEDGKKWIAEGLSDFVNDVDKRGMTLAFEDYGLATDLICSATDCLDILAKTDPRVQFVFDTGNFELVGEHAADCFEELLQHTCHYHFKDLVLDDSPSGFHGTYFGEGAIKNKEIAKAIRKTNYNGWVALESDLQGNNGPRETIFKELPILKSMF